MNISNDHELEVKKGQQYHSIPNLHKTFTPIININLDHRNRGGQKHHNHHPPPNFVARPLKNAVFFVIPSKNEHQIDKSADEHIVHTFHLSLY